MNSQEVQKSFDRLLSEFFGCEIFSLAEILPEGYKSNFINIQSIPDEVEMVATIEMSSPEVSVQIAQGENSTEQEALIKNLIQAFGGKVVS